ncbi:MAG: hypothetical protein KME17_08135 [Cyanosarcina radialis HA8281-LM2]|jgi:hypothetical protein|nr:hypothetical protein [Cyanosarcina radialis HA8281-LM2]
MKTVEAIDTYKVRISYPDLGVDLDMDFEPIVNYFGLNRYSNYVLCHWQAKPKGFRGYGWFVRAGDRYRYHAIDWDKIECDGLVRMQPLQIDENVFTTIPTAVLFLPNTTLVKRNCWTISRVF